MNGLARFRSGLVVSIPLEQTQRQQGMCERGLFPLHQSQSQLLFRQFKPLLFH